ncbi:MAG: cupin domain-containing protein [Candidatus Competibacter sp.]|nr:cupin domain-containing protein [Candidatus Competibacter sp.]MDG4584090.1 cupin domain-containing protein [Candidatus Competibacter sp.]
MTPKVLGELSPARFLAEYWQKQPLLVRGAWPGFQDPLTPEELAGLACEEEVESRLVLERGGEKPWAVRHGPFADEDFLKLPDSHWTLLVQDVEKHAPDLAALLEPFRFIPDWRIDDLMISYAPPEGSVGPHVDDYDVFLLQGRGRRRWSINRRPVAEGNFLPDTELRILREFVPEQEWVLEPGDLLYLPPRVAHHGVALEPCLTYSVGFRAPSHRELIGGFLEFLLDGIDPEARYADPDLSVQEHPGEIALAALARVRNLLRRTIALDDETLAVWLGRYLSEPKPGSRAEPETEPYTEEELREHLRGGGSLERNPGSRFHFIAEPEGETILFADGQEFALGPAVAFMAPLLCRYRTLTPARLREALKQPEARQLLLDLLNEGLLAIYEEED